jgi:predicted cupin superfamily sugar epimerase
MTAEEIIKLLSLEPLTGEEGYYRETYRSPERVLPGAFPKRYRDNKSLGTAIYYLLTPENRSILHRLPTDEIYIFI